MSVAARGGAPRSHRVPRHHLAGRQHTFAYLKVNDGTDLDSVLALAADFDFVDWPTLRRSLRHPTARGSGRDVGPGLSAIGLSVTPAVPVRYAGDVANPFVQGLASNFEQALRLMEAALADCPDELWETDLWPDEAPTAPTPHGGLHGSAPWFLGYHALKTLDYDLAAEFEPWQPPQPFDEHT